MGWAGKRRESSLDAITGELDLKCSGAYMSELQEYILLDPDQPGLSTEGNQFFTAQNSACTDSRLSFLMMCETDSNVTLVYIGCKSQDVEQRSISPGVLTSPGTRVPMFPMFRKWMSLVRRLLTSPRPVTESIDQTGHP